MNALTAANVQHAWSPARQRAAAGALLLAVGTAAIVAAAGGTAWQGWAAVVYIAAAGIAVTAPPWILAQVVSGQLLAFSILLTGAGAMAIVPVIASTIASAELLAGAARMQAAPSSPHSADMRGAVRAALIGAAVCGAVVVAGGFISLSGTVAIAAASAACVLVALVLVRAARPGAGESGS
jgi:hypothetical protein